MTQKYQVQIQSNSSGRLLCRISKLDLKDTHIKNITANYEDMNVFLRTLKKLLRFLTENYLASALENDTRIPMEEVC